MPSAYAYFCIIADELPLNEISHLMGIEPTESWEKGSVGKYKNSRKGSLWALHSPLSRENTVLEEHIVAVLDLLKLRASVVREISAKYETYLVCTGKFNESTSPGLFISKENVKLISSLGLAIDTDLYFS